MRTGPRPTQPDGTPGTPVPQQLYTLSQGIVAWLPPASGSTAAPAPEILLLEEGALAQPILWDWTARIIDADQFDTAYTLDAARHNPIGRN